MANTDIPAGSVVVDDYTRRGLVLVAGEEPLVWWFPEDADISAYAAAVPLQVVTGAW